MSFFDICINVLQSVLICLFIFSTSRKKEKYRRNLLPEIGCAAVFAVLLTVMNLVVFFESFAIFIDVLYWLLCLVIFTDGGIGQKLFLSVVPVNASAVGSFVSCTVMSLALNKPIMAFLPFDGWERTITVLFSTAVYSLIFLAVHLLCKRITPQLRTAEWLILSTVLVLSMLSYTFLLTVYIGLEDTAMRVNILFAAGVTLFVNFASFYLLSSYTLREKTDYENKLLKQQNAVQKQALEETKQQYDLARRARHDIGNLLSMIKTLNDAGKSEQISALIERYRENMPTAEKVLDTGNDYVNAVLNTKLATAAEKRIQTICTLCDLSPALDLDLCNLLSNLLDNALCACEHSTKKQIELSLTRENGRLRLTLKNTIDASVLVHNPTLETDKADKSEHGNGVGIVRGIAARRAGYADWFEKDGYFCCHVDMAEKA